MILYIQQIYYSLNSSKKVVIMMTKKQYLNSLRNSLRFKLSSEELLDIMDDMEECFEAGITEGKSEEEICEGLGSPKAAAAELSAGRKNIFPAAVRPAVCIIIALILHYAALNTLWEPFIALIFLPPLLFLVCESPKGTAIAISRYPAEPLPFISAMLTAVGGIFLQYFVKFGFADGILTSAFSSAVCFVIIMIVSMALLIICCIKSRNIVGAILAGAVTVFSAVTLIRLLSASSKYSLSILDMASLGMIKALFYILPISAFCIILLSVTDKNALNTASLYPALFALTFNDKLWVTASRIDPLAPKFDFFKAISYHIYLIAGLVCGVLALAVTLILRRKKAAENG